MSRAPAKIARVLVDEAREEFVRRVPDEHHRALIVDGAKTGLELYRQKYEVKRAEGCAHPSALTWPFPINGKRVAFCASCARLLIA